MNNKIKTQLQQREFLALKDHNRVLIKWATGCGKSKMTIDLINNALGSFHVSKPVRVLFVVAESAHKNNWKDEFKKWHLNTDRISADVICYNSLKKFSGVRFDIIVFDEVHHVFTEKRLAIVETLSASYIYLLSATLSRGKQDVIEEIFGRFTTSTVTLKKAIQDDILPDPKVYVVALELDDENTNQEIRINNANNKSPVISWKDRMKYIAKKQPCIIKCTEKQKYTYYTDTMEYWKQRYELSKNQFQHNLWVNTGSKRKRYLGELKTDAVMQLLSVIPNKLKTVCFCASVLQAESFSVSETISSKKSSKWNEAVIDGFNRGILKRIFTVGMITEGMNLNGIRVGIITQLDGKERLFVQKQGRVMRADDPISFIFYYKDTQDENYLKTALENIDSKYVQYINNSQLKAIKL